MGDVVDLGALCARAAELQGPRLQHAVELIVDAPQPGSLVVLTDRVLLLQFITNLYEHTPQRRWWRALRTGIQLESPVCQDVKTTLGSRGGPGTLLWLATRMKRAPAGSVEDTMVEERPSDNTRVLKLRGKMRVLVVDDQRTMRQMVATLFQRLCQENAGLEIELDTAISGEHATRLTRVRRYHVVTMDQQLSESYCSAVSAAREKKRQDNELKTDTLSPRDG